MTNSVPEFDPVEQELYNLLGEPAPCCPSMELLLACGQHVLPAEAEQAVEQHIHTCRLCAQLVSDLGTLPQDELSLLQTERIAAMLPGKQNTALPYWRRYAGPIAAAAIVAVGILGLRTRYASQTAPASTTATHKAASPYIAKMAPEPQWMPLAAPGAEAISPLTRGAQRTTEPGTPLLLPAFTAYNHGDYALAEQRFSKLQGRYPQSALIPLYLGVSQLLLHHDVEAHRTLTQAVHDTHSPNTDAVHWYTAIAAQRTGAPEARALYASLCAETASRYSAESCRMAATLP